MNGGIKILIYSTTIVIIVLIMFLLEFLVINVFLFIHFYPLCALESADTFLRSETVVAAEKGRFSETESTPLKQTWKLR